MQKGGKLQDKVKALVDKYDGFDGRWIMAVPFATKV